MSTSKRPKHVEAACLPGSGIPDVCDRCSQPLTGRRRRWCSDECTEQYFTDHVFAWSRQRALQRDGGCVVPGCNRRDLEVDHLHQAKGKHGVHACVHHLDNLQVLCHEHHRIKTALQSRRGVGVTYARFMSQELIKTLLPERAA